MRFIKYFIVLYRFRLDEHFNLWVFCYAGAALTDPSVMNRPPLMEMADVDTIVADLVLALNNPP